MHLRTIENGPLKRARQKKIKKENVNETFINGCVCCFPLLFLHHHRQQVERCNKISDDSNISLHECDDQSN